jgi:hypothetical protein
VVASICLQERAVVGQVPYELLRYGILPESIDHERILLTNEDTALIRLQDCIEDGDNVNVEGARKQQQQQQQQEQQILRIKSKQHDTAQHGRDAPVK